MHGTSAPDDLTARARIRDAAFELIATEGVKGTTLRGIARRAGVSPALVNHHFGSKQGVVDAVGEWVQAQLRAATADDGSSEDPAEANARRAAAFEALLAQRPVLRSYIRRMLLEDSSEGFEWFARVVDDGATDLRRRSRSAMANPAPDVEAVAAVLSVLALGPILLPHHLEHVLGEGDGDPDGLALSRWRTATSALLRTPLYPESTTD